MRSYFPRLLGNFETKKRIGEAIQRGTVAHAFLIGGPEGSGKRTLALEIAAALNCEGSDSESSPLPCGRCNNCKRIYGGNFADIRRLTKDKDRVTIGVEPLKLLREDMFLSATESERKIYIIENAEAMTVEAQNALLKVLEEPPRGVTVLLLAEECDRILTTIKSRTQYIAMSRFDEEELEKILLADGGEAARLSREEPDKLKGILLSADGRLGLARKLASKKQADANAADRAEALTFISSISGRVLYSRIHSAVMSLPTKRAELSESLERIICALRDLIIIRTAPEARLLFYTDREIARKTGREIGIKRLLSVYDVIISTHELCTKNANVSNLLSSLAASLKIALRGSRI